MRVLTGKQRYNYVPSGLGSAQAATLAHRAFKPPSIGDRPDWIPQDQHFGLKYLQAHQSALAHAITTKTEERQVQT
jgi:hypothetical protein